MKQKQPKFSGILVVAVLMVLVLFIVSLSPLLAASGSKDTTYSEIYYYFENQQVTSFRLDLGTGSLELWLKEGKAALPESNAAASLPTGGLLTGVYSSDDNALPANGGTGTFDEIRHTIVRGLSLGQRLIRPFQHGAILHGTKRVTHHPSGIFRQNRRHG